MSDEADTLDVEEPKADGLDATQHAIQSLEDTHHGVTARALGVGGDEISESDTASKGQLEETSHETSGQCVRLADFAVGECDSAGEKIEVIYQLRPDFAVYRTQGKIHLHVDDDNPNLDALLSRHQAIYMKLTRVYSLLPADLSDTERINSDVARAVAANLTDRQELAVETLEGAETRIKKYITLKGRLVYAYSCVLTLLAVVAIAMFVRWIDDSSLYMYGKIATCGALGGFLSVAYRLSKLDIDYDADGKMNALMGSSRILIASVASIFAYFLVQSGIAFKFFTAGDDSGMYGVLAVAMAAGFSEGMVPGFIKSISNTEQAEVQQR